MRLAGDPLTYDDIDKKLGTKKPPDKYSILKYMISQPLQFNPGKTHFMVDLLAKLLICPLQLTHYLNICSRQNAQTIDWHFHLHFQYYNL